MLIACVQSDVTFANPQENVRRVIDWMRKASELPRQGCNEHSAATEGQPDRGADLVVFPECMLTGYVFEDRESAYGCAIEVEDDHWIAISQAAKTYRQHASVGFLERENDKLYNAAALIGPQGIVAVYRKVHLPYLGVDRFVDRGQSPYRVCPFDTASGATIRLGMAICYDASFPEPSRVLALDGADVIALGTNWPCDAPLTPDLLPPVRSMENHLYFVAANRVGVENGVGFSGRSSICGPDGTVLAKSSDDTETILSATIDVSVARNKRIRRTPGEHEIDRFQDRQPAFYGRIVDES